jgi:hypothetical protein
MSLELSYPERRLLDNTMIRFARHAMFRKHNHLRGGRKG